MLFSQPLEAAVDPTKPLFGFSKSPSSTQKSKLVLQSIMAKNGANSAIVSGKLVQKGDQVNQYKVISIGKNVVKLQSPEGQLTLKLFAESVKK